MLNISCLHTAQSNIEVFEAARRSLKLDHVMLKHRVRADLLAAAELAGRPTPELLERTAAELAAVGKSADGVLLTCSAIGGAVERAARLLSIPVLRVDLALAREATAGGGNVIVLCANGSTIGPTRALFEQEAVATGAAVETRLVPGAWQYFKAGQVEAYWRAIAEAADTAAGEAATVALAQSSMAGAVAYVKMRPPLTSPTVGLASMVAAATAAQAQLA